MTQTITMPLYEIILWTIFSLIIQRPIFHLLRAWDRYRFRAAFRGWLNSQKPPVLTSKRISGAIDKLENHEKHIILPINYNYPPEK